MDYFVAILLSAFVIELAVFNSELSKLTKIKNGEKVNQTVSGSVQFFEPITIKEKFKNAKKITDIL